MDLIGEEPKMTVKEVADTLGYEKDYLRKKVKELFPESVQNGVETMLTEHQVFKLKQYLVPRTLDMKIQGESAITSLDIEEMTIRVLQYHLDKVVQLKAENEAQRDKIALDAPKVEFYDQVADSKDAIDMRSAAAVLNIPNMGRNNLFKKLRDLEILDIENTPYRRFQDAGYFRVIITEHDDGYGIPRITKKTLVYPKGLDYIRKAVTK